MTLKGILHIANGKTSMKQSKLEILCDQLIDSLTVGGIAGLSTYIAAGESATFKVFSLAFGLTFLIKLKEYRKIK